VTVFFLSIEICEFYRVSSRCGNEMFIGDDYQNRSKDRLERERDRMLRIQVPMLSTGMEFTEVNLVKV
jgi:hypothetical protein